MRRQMKFVRLIAALCATLTGAVTLGGCAAGLPTYPPMDDAGSLKLIAARLDSVKSISSVAELTLTNSQGQTVTLDGAFVAQPPDRARLRAWKFGSPVLDLTILTEGVWAYAVDREGLPATNMTSLPSAGVSQALGALSGSYFASAQCVKDESTDTTLVVIGPGFGQDGVRCDIQRRTLTPRRFRLPGSGKEMELVLGQYTLEAGIAWPHRMEFRSPDGLIVIRLNDVELNGDVEKGAFVPPARATKLP
ncbi:MAG: hypothetical protein JSR77_09670 [Planctomycetes bacterium]|nr:hypothetical protein [Planctomycetota bacterium]